jgi:hypothetical protein
MREKWNVRTKGYLKIHVVIDVKTKKILSLKVTDEHVHDSKMLPELVDEIIDSASITTIGKLFAEGAYDGNEIFRNLGNNGIVHCIKVRKNVRVREKKGRNIIRNLSVLAQRKDLKKWKDISVSYVKRRTAEKVFSCLKRRFGEYVYSISFKNMVKEMILKASLYNKMISI